MFFLSDNAVNILGFNGVYVGSHNDLYNIKY